MSGIRRRIEKLEHRHTARICFSWRREFDAVENTALRKMDTKDLQELEHAISEMETGGRNGLTPSQRSVLDRWEAVFARTAKDMAVPFSMYASDRWL